MRMMMIRRRMVTKLGWLRVCRWGRWGWGRGGVSELFPVSCSFLSLLVHSLHSYSYVIFFSSIFSSPHYPLPYSLLFFIVFCSFLLFHLLRLRFSVLFLCYYFYFPIFFHSLFFPSISIYWFFFLFFRLLLFFIVIFFPSRILPCLIFSYLSFWLW